MAEITDDMTRMAHGFGPGQFVGRTIVAAHEITDSDRNESLLLLDDGTAVVLSCDPGYKDEHYTIRDPEHWEVVLYDATDVEAGRVARAEREKEEA